MTGELAGITGPGTAFIAGLVTSLHCAGMCGPLACALMSSASGKDTPACIKLDSVRAQRDTQAS